tara:strand:+ start:244 stop:705 length:462 start_codon:yes stop_codon:yes gene_type:complete
MSKSIIDEIFELKQEYRGMKDMIDLKSAGSQELDFQPLYYPRLLEIRKDLSCLSLDLAKETAKHGRDFRNRRAGRETQKYLKQRELMDKGAKATPSEAEAKAFTAHLLSDEALSEGFYMSGKLILNQVNEVLRSLNQDISIIKKEYESLTNIS